MSGAAGGGELVLGVGAGAGSGYQSRRSRIQLFPEIGKILLVKVKVCATLSPEWFGEAISPRRNDKF